MNGRVLYTLFKAGIPKARKAASSTSAKEQKTAA